MSNYFDKLNTHFAAVSSGQERSRKFFIIVRVFISTFQKFWAEASRSDKDCLSNGLSLETRKEPAMLWEEKV